MKAGLDQYGTILGITQITSSGFQTQLDTYISQDTQFNAGRSGKQTASAANQTAMSNVASWLTVAKSVLASRLGIQWSTDWAQAGFVDSSLQIPANADSQMALMLRMGEFFTSHSDYEAPAINITAAQATLLRNSALDAQQTLTAATVTLKSCGDSREESSTSFTSTMRNLIALVGVALAPDDSRWSAFGLNQPAANTTPGQPVSVTAHMDGNGNIVVECPAVPMATRYRWRMLLVGVQTEYQLAARSVDPVGLIKDVQPGQTARIIVQAVNGSSQGVASEPIEFTVLLPETAEVKKPVTVAPAMELPAVVVSTNGNGHNGRNGHSTVTGHRA